MGLIKNYLEQRTAVSADWAKWFGLSGSRSNAGVNVTTTSAMRQSAVFACVNVLACSFGCVPWITYRRLSRGKERAINDPIYFKLHDRPNPEQNSIKFRIQAMAQALLYGNAYAEIQFDEAGKPAALWPLPAWRVKPKRTQDGELFYHLDMDANSIFPTIKGGDPYDFPAFKIWHFSGLTTDGINGLSVIANAKEAIGLAMATEEFGEKFFSQGANVGGVAMHPGKLTEQGSANLRKGLEEKYAGLGNASRIMLLEEGMKFEKAGIPNNEGQFLETRLFQVVDIARMFHVPLHMINELTHATFSNIEQQDIEFIKHTMNPWYVSAEQETNYKLFGLGAPYFTEFLADGLLRGDSQARAAFYRELFYLASISPNEIREKENWNPIDDPGGDDYYVQANLVPMRMAGQLQSGTQQNSSVPLLENRTRALFDDAVRRMAEREKQNILRAWKRKPEEFDNWLGDFYRDFPEFMRGILKPVFLATGRQDIEGYIKNYVESSRGLLIGDIETVVGDWEHRRVLEMAVV